MLHPPGAAFKAALAGINGARAYVAAMCCGMLQASLGTAVRYTREIGRASCRERVFRVV